MQTVQIVTKIVKILSKKIYERRQCMFLRLSHFEQKFVSTKKHEWSHTYNEHTVALCWTVKVVDLRLMEVHTRYANSFPVIQFF